MTQNPFLVDIAIAVLGAILILVLTPGVAVAGMIALLVLVACAVSVMFDSRRRRSGSTRARRQAGSPQRRPQPRRPRAGG